MQWALKGLPEETVVAENKRINQVRTTLQAQAAELRTRIKASQQATISLPKLESFVLLVQDKISASDFEMKRMALDMLGITVWLDSHDIEITGFVDAEYEGIATKSS